MKTKSIITGLFFSLSTYMISQSSWIANPVPQTGVDCDAFGDGSLRWGGSTYNTAIGHDAMYWAGFADECVAVGAYSLKMISLTYPDQVSRCTALGYKALFSNSTGDDNTAAGHEALYSNTSGRGNTATGHSALYSNITGGANTATGYRALFSNSTSGSVDGIDNTAIGTSALENNVSGSDNTAVGKESLFNNTMADRNTAAGYQSLYKNSLGSTSGGGSDNVAIGNSAMYTNKDGSYNTAMGNNALYLNTNGNYNVALGTEASYKNTSGSNNLAVGQSALHENGAGDYNVALGTNALYYNKSSYCVGLGYAALYTSNNLGNDYNTAIGIYALGSQGSPGNYNTAAGYYADVNGTYQNATAFGNGAVVSGTNKVRLGDANILLLQGKPSTWTSPSDSRFKSNLNYNEVKGLEFILKLRPVSYNLDTKKLQGFLVKNMPDSVKKIHLSKDYEASTAIRRTGFIAQEVEKAAQECGYKFNGVSKPQNENDNYSLCYSLFVVPLTKAVQEQNTIIQEQNQSALQMKQQSISQQQNLNRLIAQAGVSTAITEGLGLNAGFSMDILPNPFTDETTFSYNIPGTFGSAYLTITNLEGIEITSFNISKNGTGSIKITSEKLNPGLYLYSIITDGKIMGTKRMVVADK